MFNKEEPVPASDIVVTIVREPPKPTRASATELTMKDKRIKLGKTW